MLAISAIVGVSTVGYLLDQALREQNFNDYNKYSTQIPYQEINECAEQYPWNFIESFGNQGNQGNECNLGNQGKDYQSPTFINSPNSIEALNNSGQPPPPYLINGNERPVEDFKVNNMVPFFSGSGTGQNMKGTGVPEANVNSDNFNLGNDNLTPNYSTLATFTGCDNTYLHKREAPNLFSPLERRDRNTIPGEDAAAVRPELDRFTTSILTKNDEKPFESLKIGPGINIAANLPNDGLGYNSGLSTQVLPDNVGAYKLTQLQGRIAGENFQGPALPEALIGTGPSFKTTLNSKSNNGNNGNNGNDGNDGNDKNYDYESIGVTQKKPFLNTGLDRRCTMATPALIQAPMVYSPQILPSGTHINSGTNVSFGDSVAIKTK